MLDKINWNPQREEILKFGRRMPLVFLIAGLYLWKAGAVGPGLPHHPFQRWWWSAWGATGSWRQILAVVFAAAGVVVFVTTHFIPRAGLILWRAFTLQGWLIGMLLARTAMTIAYFLVFTPVAVFFRIIGRDALKRRFAPGEVESYWEPHSPPPDKERYKRMF